MNKPTGLRIICYGMFVLAVGFLATMYDPKTAQFGFNPAAKTALISGGICGGISILWGLLVRAGLNWGRVAAFLTTLIFLAAFTWRGFMGWRAFASGQPEKWFAATAITLMWLASVALTVFLLKGGSSQTAKRPGRS